MDDPTIISWNQKMVTANKAIRVKSEELTKNQRHKWKDTYLAQFEDNIAVEEELQHNWGSREARNKLSDAQATLHKVRQHIFQFQESAILSKWARVGDRYTKDFFEHYAGSCRAILIKQLMEGDKLISTQTELENHIHSFYEDSRNCTSMMNKYKRMRKLERIVFSLFQAK